MNDSPDAPAGGAPAPPVAVCASCSALYPDEYRCACIVARAQLLAAETHDRRRLEVPRWRRPRTWDALPEPVRQAATVVALDVVDLVEGAGWRLVLVGQPRHAIPDPDAVTPPDGLSRVRGVVQ